ncbi:hypothetical protein HPC38_00980 [Pasteurellaceae bacterium HPA106]|nr:hypothetical protein [Spirabiliibacterium pneumoniae]
MYQGKPHFAFSLSLLTLRGRCKAFDVMESIGLLGIEDRPLTSEEKMLEDLSYLGQQLEIEGIPQSVLTPEFLLDNLLAYDYTVVIDALTVLRKKRSHDSASPALPNPVDAPA